MAGWLAPYRVIDLTDERGLLAGGMLARLGAEVIQIEPPGGSSARRAWPLDAEGRSFVWSTYAAAKQSVTLDLATEAGRESLRDLARTADFMLENGRPGEMARLGVGHDDLRALNPRLIHVSITAFGAEGPKADYQESDLVLWAAGGPLRHNTDLDGPPLRISAPQAWLHAAGDAAGAALVAHFARLSTGLGQHIEISAQQSIAQATLFSFAAAALGQADYFLNMRADRAGSKWAVRDGLVELGLAIGPPLGGWSNNVFAWMRAERALSAWLEDWDWLTVPDRLAAGEIDEAQVLAARDAIAAFLAPRTKAELVEGAMAHKVLLAPVNTIADLLASPQLAHRGLFATVKERGAARTLPWAFAHGPAGMFAAPAPAPDLGEHNGRVLGELGDGTVGSPAAAAAAKVGARPFAGLKVLDLAWVVAGPAVGRVLADYGATVVRVDTATRVETARAVGPFPGGVVDPQRSALYDTCNAGKLGLALDLAKPAAREVVRDLARWADVLVESFAPGQMDRWGLTQESFRALNPALVGLSTSLMGQSGPYAPLAGFGNIGAAMAGFQGLAGEEGKLPIGPFGPYTDFVAPRFSLVALLAALDRRRRTGEGCWLDVSQAEAGIQFLAPQVAQAAAGEGAAAAMGNRDPQMSPHGVFPCAGDDQWVALGVTDDAQWKRLAAVIGGEALDSAFAGLAGRKADEDRLEALIAGWTATQGAFALEARLQGLGLAAHKAADAGDMMADTQLAFRGHFQRLAHPLGGESLFEASRFTLSATPAAYRRCAPHVGRDNQEILAGILGYGEDRLAELEAAGALR